MSPWCRPPVLPRILLVFSQACDFYTRAAANLAARAGVEPAATCFRDRAPYRHRVPGNGDTDGCGPRTGTWNVGRPARFRPGNDRFGDGHDAVSPLASGPGDGTRTRGLHARDRIFLERPTGLAPASRAWTTRTLLLSDGRTEMEKGWTPRCSPPMGSNPVSFCSGPIVKGDLRQHDPRYSSGARELPLASGQGQIKNPALVSEGGV